MTLPDVIYCHVTSFDVMRFYVVSCGVMGLCGVMWCYVLLCVLSGVMWRYVAICGVLWRYVELCGVR